MCGIAALFAPPHAALDTAALASCLQVVARRGPEASRVLALGNVWLAHAALGFVDVEANAQPLALADGSTLLWNGELYNWRELSQRHGLAARNDSHALLLGLRAFGPQFLSELDGQFALVALLPSAAPAERVLIARDKWGICPLVFGHTPAGALAIGSTLEAVEALGVYAAKPLPAGMFGLIAGTALELRVWYRLPRTPRHLQRAPVAERVRAFAEQRVHSRIPAEPRDLYTTLGGIDSQFVTASVARAVHGMFGGAVTVVPWQGSGAPSAGDLPCVQATLARLASEGIQVAHHVVELTPELAQQNLSRLCKLLGPDLFHLLCGLAEDLVAATVQRLGGRAIMTAGGPDEAGRSYDRWTFLHRGLDEELAWYRLCEQFASSEGVRAGLVFGERGLENRVPLADLIELAAELAPEHKQRIYEPGDGLRVASLGMETKIFWREALRDALPAVCLAARKEPIHGSTGALPVLHYLLRHDAEFQRLRREFALYAAALGWNGIVFADLSALDPANVLTECQLYALYRWSLVEPEKFRWGGSHRYGAHVDYLPRCDDEPAARVHKPLCHDWLLGRDVPLRPVQ